MLSTENIAGQLSESLKLMTENKPPTLEDFLHTQKQANRMILIGSPKWVQRIIHLMHTARIAEVRDWSQPMPTRNPNEVISLLQRPKPEDE